MTSLPIRKNHDSRAHLADYPRNFQPVLPGVFNSSIRNIKGLAPSDAENSGGFGSFGSSLFGGASRAHLTTSKVENARAAAKCGHLQQSSTTGLLHIVAMRGNGQNIDHRGGHWSRFPCSIPT